jgi:hypothetical protein
MSLVQDYVPLELKPLINRYRVSLICKKAKIPESLLSDAIDLAPEIKPLRMTTIHTHGSRKEAKELFRKDPILSKLLYFSIP